MQTLRQALEPVVDRVLETDGGDGEAGSGDGDTERGGGEVEEKEKCLSDGGLQERWHKDELSTRRRCNFPLCVLSASAAR